VQRGGVVQPVLQRHVFVALNCAGVATIRWPVVRAAACARLW
jgi:hypothetical protein